MIAHLILMDVHDQADTPLVLSQVRSLSGKIPGLLHLHGGRSVISGARSWDLGFLMFFDDPEAVEAYQNHPEHVAVASAIRGCIRDMGTADIDIGPAVPLTTSH